MSSADTGREDRSPLIVCAGIAVIDHIFKLDRFPTPDAKSRADEFTAVGGGCAANAAVALTRLGGRARLAAPLGDDTIGETIIAHLRRETVECGNVVRVAGATSPVSAILVDAAGERIIVNHRDPQLDGARLHDPEDLLLDAQGVLIDNRFPDFVLPVATSARKRGLTVLLDGDKPTGETDALLRICSHIVFSAEGLRATAERDDLGAALLRIAGRTDAFVAVTDGANSMVWIDNGDLRRMAPFRVRAVDTLGAGDIFHGAFALALAEAQSIETGLRFAAAAAAIKCTRFGGITGAPTRKEAEDFLADRP